MKAKDVIEQVKQTKGEITIRMNSQYGDMPLVIRWDKKENGWEFNCPTSAGHWFVERNQSEAEEYVKTFSRTKVEVIA